ncbi:DJ-1/PfpI family protein [Oerskovia turbata]|uniref:DJ-1/PfpI family protein n=1 Tax=Oerskovia turbata TaxID=1713 RepID=A0A4Q1KNX4_9CELL|nr:DJ-1/PfpI family protein [Oerskovia turbata]RXR23133.1 DJ-1/PfpI family protein [Oerskovia turbata]RXR31668.1 DJ-1/PfpI family protein [Oerskovia turbata]TGJ97198.1 DJ-1/PfpI family protein [Actinotalea fermentans ATCC 43279 = JCM 9966 = DSM 3133]
MTTGNGLSVGIFVFDGAEELNVAGPYEVFTTWRERSSLKPRVSTFSWDGRGVRLAQGLHMVPDGSADDVDPVQVLVHPGGPGVRRLVGDPAHLAWLHAMRARTPLLTSVCTGSLAYAAAGLLAGRPATTHWDHVDELARLDPSILVDTETRFVDDGDVVTSAGVSAGIDMALHLVERLENAEVAEEVRRALQYEG